MKTFVLTINPGSVSTKIAVFKGTKLILEDIVKYKLDNEIFNDINDQLEIRYKSILKCLVNNNINPDDFEAVVGRGGLLRPIPSGVYKTTPELLKDLRNGYGGKHASNLGGQLAYKFGIEHNCLSYIVDPVSVDELNDLARFSGLKDVERISQVHALNVRSVAIQISKNNKKNFCTSNYIVAHLGSGISIVALKSGKMIDVNNANNEGPFSTERTGTLPIYEFLNYIKDNSLTINDAQVQTTKKGGLFSYLGTKDARKVESEICNGNSYTKKVYDAMAYQISKEIGAMSTVLKGKIDNIILTGGLAFSKPLIENITKSVDFLAPIIIFPGENEMVALNNGYLRIKNNEESVKIYDNYIT
jgi:butyrate kinase